MTQTIREKAEYHRQTSERMERHFVLPDWSVREKLALAGRMLAAEGTIPGSPGIVGPRRPGRHLLHAALRPRPRRGHPGQPAAGR